MSVFSAHGLAPMPASAWRGSAAAGTLDGVHWLDPMPSLSPLLRGEADGLGVGVIAFKRSF